MENNNKIENPTNLPDEQFEALRKSLSKEAFAAFLNSQPKKTDGPFKPWSEEAWDEFDKEED